MNNLYNRPTHQFNLFLSSCVAGETYQPLPNSTLNENLDIQSSATRSAGSKYNLKGFVIGFGGVRTIPAQTGTPERIVRKIHEAKDAAPFQMMPIVLRELNNDLPPNLRSNYFYRKQITTPQGEMIAYFGKRINASSLSVQSLELKNEGGSLIPRQFQFTNEDLKPVSLTDRFPNSVIRANGEFLLASLPVEILLNEFDTTELKRTAQILYGSEERAEINEVSLILGEDRRISIGGGANTFDEVVCSIAMNHMAVRFNAFYTTVISETTQAGIQEPLFGAVQP